MHIIFMCLSWSKKTSRQFAATSTILTTHIWRIQKSLLPFFRLCHWIAMSVLYSAIAVSLRRQDKALGSQSVQQANQIKRQVIKMAFCVMAAFYFCILPMISYFILWEYEILLSCSFRKVLLFFYFYDFLLNKHYKLLYNTCTYWLYSLQRLT